MKLLAGVEPLTSGGLIVGPNVTVGYFAQELSDSVSGDQSLYNELSGSAEGMTTTEIRNLLGAMLFSGDDANKRVGVLSGGEKGRLALAKVLAHRNNVLLLDEPTNNLDIVAKDTLLEALNRFAGTVVIVSHDRHILNALANEVVEVGKGHAIRYLGNYDEYLKKKEQREAAALNGNARQQKPKPASPKLDGGPARTGNREQPRKGAPDPRKRTELESTIEKKETERAALAAEMNDPNFYLSRKDADQLIHRYESLGREIEQLYGELEKFENV